ncbi:hypothetical protein [Endozoicomonas atrinae]|uniref:hypothetical protein n=1 Tax=Endozoicomonas atrinae TaxID=1333660 RepID=UPI000825FBDB|nr:hypothetical protein [Endozoicomonas atrinae]
MEKIIKEADVGRFEFILPAEVRVGGELEWRFRFEASQEFKPGSHLRITVPAYQHQRSEEYLQAYDYWMPNYLWVETDDENIRADVHVEKVTTAFLYQLNFLTTV